MLLETKIQKEDGFQKQQGDYFRPQAYLLVDC